MPQFDLFRDASVVVTGHTGFKGSWLSAWLTALGARVTGIALDPPTMPSHFEAAALSQVMRDLRIDIRNAEDLTRAITDAAPDFVFHLAAQPLVRRSYADPVETYGTNVIGTLHVLEALRALRQPAVAVLITSDKCYDNVEWTQGYKETDRLGGKDPYSASKGAAELVIRSHVASFLDASGVRVGVARAGNVIGGGDWAADRIVPDCIRSWSRGEEVSLRNPRATRPWQHVLEPLSGYLTLAAGLAAGTVANGEPFNFGPADEPRTVLDLVTEMAKHWDRVRWLVEPPRPGAPHEAGLLQLDCDKARQALDWEPAFTFADTVRLTAEWYRAFYADPGSAAAVTRAQIAAYSERAASNGLAWTR